MPRVDWESVGEEAVVRAQEAISRAENDAHKQKVKNYNEERQLATLARKIKRDALTDEERFQKAVMNTVRAHKQGRITLVEKNRELERLKRSHLGVNAAVKQRLASEAALSARAKQLIGEEETAAQRRIRLGREARELEQRGKITREQMLTVLRRLRFEHEGGAAAQERANAAMQRANRLTAQHASLGQRYAQRIAALRADRDASTMTPEVFGAEATRIKREMFGPGKDAEAATAKARELAEAQAAVNRAQQRYQQIVRRSETATQRYAREVGELKTTFLNSGMSAKEYRQEVGRLRHEIRGGAEEERRAAEAAKQRQDAAARIVDRNLTPMERYKRGLREVIRLERSGELSTEQRRRATAALRRELQATTAAGKRAFGATMQAQLGGYLSAAAGIGAAINEIANEIDAVRQSADRAGQAQQTAADARRELVVKLSAVPKEQANKVLAIADNLPNHVPIPANLAYQTISATSAAHPDPLVGAKAGEMALSLLRTAPGGAELASGLVDVADAIQTKDFNEAMGVALIIQNRARVESLPKVAENAPKVLTAGDVAGLSVAESAAFYAGITTANKDRHGDTSRTAAMNFMDRVGREFFDDEKLGIRRKYGLSVDGSDEVREQIALLRADRRMAEEFFKHVSFDARGKAGLIAFLTGRSPAGDEAYASVMSDMASTSAIRAVGLRAKQNIDDSRLEQIALAGMTSDAAIEQTYLQGPPTLTEQQKVDQRNLILRAMRSTPRPDYMRNQRRITAKEIDYLRFFAYDSEYTLDEAAEFNRARLDAIDRRQSITGQQNDSEPVRQLRRLVGQQERSVQALESIADRPAPPANPRQE
ncbi:MAG: hypothetical protein AAF805_00080 [Planctomycetota bacterium]